MPDQPGIPFAKLHGCGNDYLYVDCITSAAPPAPGELARAMSDRHFGAGSDGLILALPSEIADLRMRMFNADGSEGIMCGNGVRCLAKFAFDRGLSRANPMRIETLRGALSVDLHQTADGQVQSATVDMDVPILDPRQIPVHLPGQRIIDHPLPDGRRITCVSMGSAHAVEFVNDVSAVVLESTGPAMESASIFPDRVNYHVAQILARDRVRVRTWERGSGITLACGTGACAVVVAGVLTERLARQTTVHMPGGDLAIEWRESDGRAYLTGPTVEVYQGVWPV